MGLRGHSHKPAPATEPPNDSPMHDPVPMTDAEWEPFAEAIGIEPPNDSDDDPYTCRFCAGTGTDRTGDACIYCDGTGYSGKDVADAE